MPIIQVNVSTGERVVREYTQQELDAISAMQAEHEAHAAKRLVEEKRAAALKEDEDIRLAQAASDPSRTAAKEWVAARDAEAAILESVVKK